MQEEEYEPYGEEWKKSLMQFRKSDLIDDYKERCLVVNELLENLKAIKEVCEHRKLNDIAIVAREAIKKAT